MPGIKKGISGAIQVGYNFGIIGNIDGKKLQPAIEAIKYMTSRKIQKNLVLKEMIVSGITSLYDEEDICSNIKFCDFYKYPQLIMKPENKFKSDDYFEKFTHYFFDFLYKNESAPNALKKMEDLTKVYSISIDTNESHIGITFLIIYICLLIIIPSSLILIFIKKFRNNFYFLPETFWIISIMGIVMILLSGFTKIGKITVFKCHVNCFLITLGYTFIYIPFLYKLIVVFPDNNNIYLMWVYKNKYLFFSIFVAIDILLNAVTLVKPYHVKVNFVDEGENYYICDSKHNAIINLAVSAIIGYKFLLLLIMLLLIFIEWNMTRIKIDIRLIFTSLYLNIIAFLILMLFNSFKINNYILYYVIQEILILLIVLSNFISLYIIRIFLKGFNIEVEESRLLENLRNTSNQTLTRDKSHVTSTSFSEEISYKTGKSSTSNSVLYKIVDNHKDEFTFTDSSFKI